MNAEIIYPTRNYLTPLQLNRAENSYFVLLELKTILGCGQKNCGQNTISWGDFIYRVAFLVEI